MDRSQAIHIIEGAFKNSYNESHFLHFIRNLFNDVDENSSFILADDKIPETYRSHIKLFKRIAEYTDPDGKELDIIAVNLKKDSGVERARSMQRNFLAWHLKSNGDKDGALVAYHTDGVEDWRFSFVRMDYHTEKNEKGKYKAITDFTPPRRYSFLVGKNEPIHTAQQQLIPLLEDTENNPTLAQIEQAFNIEIVTKEFFDKYKLLFEKLFQFIEDELQKNNPLREQFEIKGIDADNFTKKLLGQIVFLYFIQKKGWLGVPKDQTWGKGDRQYLRSLLNSAIRLKQNYFSDYLESLFYEALATDHRGGNAPSYFPKFDCKIPFLNGGLFEAEYNWRRIKISLPNSYFTNDHETDEGDIGDGILDIFDRYNFTVKEDEPLEKEVAVDPEMLGKVFENLLDASDRKSKGAFYTPREIVHFMCQESLINYLDVTLNKKITAYNNIGDRQSDAFGNTVRKGQLKLEHETNEARIPRNILEWFIKNGGTVFEIDGDKSTHKTVTHDGKNSLFAFLSHYANEIDVALANIRICDPSIGSGAFPVGMMTEIVQARQILQYFNNNNKSTYELKRDTIQDCIYGVDIERSAIDIAKLRLWLSLVVDEDDFHKIKPLPNLDYKIIVGNSLIGLHFKSRGYEQQLERIETLKCEYFKATEKEQKITLRSEIDGVLKSLYIASSKSLGYTIDFDFELAFSEIYREKGGFDLFIGNPPYLEARSGEFTNELKEKLQKAVLGRWKEFAPYITRGADLLIYFLEVGIFNINQRGTVVFITQNSWLDTEYGKKFQQFLLKKTDVKAIIDSDYKYFDSKNGPNINTVISIFQGKVPKISENTLFSRFHENFEKIPANFNDLSFDIKSQYATVKSYSKEENTLSEIKWGILLSATDDVLSLIKKVYSKGKRVEEIEGFDISIGQGLNLVKAFVVNNIDCKSNPIIRKGLIPFLTNDDGAPFDLSVTENYLIDSNKYSANELKELRKNKILAIDAKQINKPKPILILPRGIGRHFCAINSCGAYSSSYVDIYDNLGNLPTENKLNLWLYLNSSVCWLLREISGRKNLGGGMLKAEAVDLKSFPIYFEFNCYSKIKNIYSKLKKREALDTLEEITTEEHAEIDEIVYSHLSLTKAEVKKLNNFLQNIISERNIKSRS